MSKLIKPAVINGIKYTQYIPTKREVIQEAKRILSNSGIEENALKYHTKAEYNKWVVQITDLINDMKFYFGETYTRNGANEWFDVIVKYEKRQTPVMPFSRAPADQRTVIVLKDLIEAVCLYGSDFDGETEEQEEGHRQMQSKVLDVIPAMDLQLLGASVEY